MKKISLILGLVVVLLVISGCDSKVDNINSDVGAYDELKGILEESQSLSYTKTDKSITNLQGLPESNAEMVYYVKDSDNYRSDTIFSGSESVNSRYLLNGENTYCSILEGEPFCGQPADPSEDKDSIEKSIIKGTCDCTVEKLQSKKIAGVNTDCFKIKTSDLTVEKCYGPEKIPLYSKLIADGLLVEATTLEYSLGVDDLLLVIPE